VKGNLIIENNINASSGARHIAFRKIGISETTARINRPGAVVSVLLCSILMALSVHGMDLDTRLLGICSTDGAAMAVAVSGNYAYVANDESGLKVIDVSNPDSPRVVASYDTLGFAWGVTVSGNYAYEADSGAGLQIIDISDPTHPQYAGGYNTTGTEGIRGLCLCGRPRKGLANH
jgi:hypothetical protein